MNFPPKSRSSGWLPVIWSAFAACSPLLGDDSTAQRPLTPKQFSNLVHIQPILADRPIFDGDTFPKIDFVEKDLVKAALGNYSLRVRFFDAGWKEVEKPSTPGRYGAWVQIRFPNGSSEERHLNLFKTAVPYFPAKDPYHATVQYPAAFGLSKEVLEREQWNSDDFTNYVFGDDSGKNENFADLVVALHDFDADPVRWHGFNSSYVNDGWWTGLEKSLGIAQDYPHLLSLPDGYDKDPVQRWPLILFLHGSGERGTDLTLLKTRGPQGYINQGHPLPFIVVSPQCPLIDSWSPERLMRLVDQIESAYRVDPKRIYVTGLSMGGRGTYDLAATYPDKFAAIAPLSGREDPEIADRLKTVPTWIFHGEEDTTVPARYSVEIDDRMKAVGAEVKLTLYPGVGHGGWEKTYADPALYAWFLQHSR